MSAYPLFDRLLEDYNIYPNVLGYDYFQKPIPSDLSSYDYVFIHSDFGFPIKCNIVQLHTGAEQTTYSWFPFQSSDDFKPLPLSEPTDIPCVGFVGRIPIINGKLHKGFEPRYLSAKLLMESDDICSDFHVRWGTEGTACGFWGGMREREMNSWKPLFATNMLANQYNLCARGNGNYSQRFYETLASRRIPVYIDSGGRLAFDHFKDYYDDPPFVHVTDVNNVENDILEFHSTHNIQDAQESCYDMWNDFFTQDAQERLFRQHCSSMKKYTW
jgi:hypothetical protein